MTNKQIWHTKAAWIKRLGVLIKLVKLNSQLFCTKWFHTFRFYISIYFYMNIMCWPYISQMALFEHAVCCWSALRCCIVAHLTLTSTVGFFQANYLHTHTHRQSWLLRSSSAAILPGLQTSWSTVSQTKDEWTLGIQRGRRVLAVRDIPAVWLVMCAKPGKLLASLASPPLVSSWWMAVVLATPPVVTTGTARSRVLLLVPMELRTWPWGLPQTAWGRRRSQTNSVVQSCAQQTEDSCRL